MIRYKYLAVAVAAAVALGTTGTAAAVSFTSNQWKLSVNGNVNGFLDYNSCDNSSVSVQGGLVCNTGPNGHNVSAIESGLLPSAIVFKVSTKQDGIDIAGTIGFYPGLNTSITGKHGIGRGAINVRQNFLTFGTPEWGTVKVGRDLGLFQSHAILSDMTLLGVGSGAAFLGGNTTLGRIGIGYVYADWIPQISYKSPKFDGFQFAGGVFQPFEQIPFSENANSVTMSNINQPGYQLQGTYSWKGPIKGTVWADYMWQRNETNPKDTNYAGAGLPNGEQVTADAFDVGGKASVGMGGGTLAGVASYYKGYGIGTTAIGFDGVSFANGVLEKRDSDGWYVQATYKIGKPKFGISYGESTLDLASNETAATNPDLVYKNSSAVAGLYYGLTPALNLVLEYTHTRAENQAGQTTQDNSVATGAIFFF
ncbi:MAG TPA: porin [Gammaproteobacteria bacterium]|nr:porin [Gammaproteobacteria bacterium]